MKKNPRTKEQQLLAENEDLRRRLEEAEETLRAIHEGEVDALVVSNPQGELVFTLKGAEHPYRVFVEAMNEGAATLDDGGTILYCNYRFAEMLKLTTDKVIGSSIHRFIPPADRSGFESSFQRGKQEDSTADISLRGEDQEMIPVHLSFNLLHEQDIPVVCMVAMDLTDRNRLEEELRQLNAQLERRVQDRTSELRESEQRWATTLASIGDAVIAADLEGRIRFMNPVAEQLTGWTLSEASQEPVKQVFNIIDEVTRLEVENPVAKVLEPGMISGLANHTLLVRKDGTEVPIDDSGAPIRDQNGKITGVVLVFRDITERRRAEEALRQSEEQARRQLTEIETIYDSAHVGLCVFDRQLRYVRINRFLAEINGIPAEEHIGKTVREAVAELADTAEEMADRIFRTGEPMVDVEFSGTTRAMPGIQRFWIEQWLPLKNKEGETIGINVVVEETTERKQAEEALRKARDELEIRVQEQTQELRDAVTMLEAEIAQRKSLETELRQSEKQIRFFASQILTAQETERRRLAAELHDSVAGGLTGIKMMVERASLGGLSRSEMENLTSKLKSAIEETRRIIAALRPGILDDLGVLAALGWLSREFSETHPDINVTRELEVEETQVPDPLKTPIFRITQEALNNIAKHSKADLVTIWLRKKDESIELMIQDNGGGFNIGVTFSTEGHTKHGLGLSSMRERTELSGGTFSIESSPGSGTRITATWPAQ